MGEVSHAILEAEHYKLWRENPLYRMECYLLELEAEKVLASIDLEECSEIETHTPEKEWVRRQWDIINQLRLDNEHLRKQWYEHLKEDREYRAKRKTNRYNKYIP